MENIGKHLLQKNIDKTILSSIMWKTIVDIYKDKKNIDLSDYLISISSKGNIFFIKTNNGMINKEISNIQADIIKKFSDKITKLGVKLGDIELKYI